MASTYLLDKSLKLAIGSPQELGAILCTILQLECKNCTPLEYISIDTHPKSDTIEIYGNLLNSHPDNCIYTVELLANVISIYQPIDKRYAKNSKGADICFYRAIQITKLEVQEYLASLVARERISLIQWFKDILIQRGISSCVVNKFLEHAH